MGQIGPRAVRYIYIYMPVCVYKWSCGLRGSRGPKKIIMDGVSLPSRKGEKVVIENYEKEWIWAVQVQLDFYPSPTGASLDRVWLWLKKIVTTNLDCLGPLQLQPDNDVQHNFFLKARHKIWLEIASVLWRIIFWQRGGLKVVQHLTFTHAKITFKPHLDKNHFLQLLSDLRALVWPSKACRSRRHLPLIFDENRLRARSVAIKTTQF